MAKVKVRYKGKQLYHEANKRKGGVGLYGSGKPKIPFNPTFGSGSYMVRS